MPGAVGCKGLEVVVVWVPVVVPVLAGAKQQWSGWCGV